MRIPRTREEALGAIEQEVRAEQARSLGRAGQRLEAQLRGLDELGALLAEARGEHRLPLLAAHAELRRHATLSRWYLTVQREAIGLRHPDDLEAAYPIPPAIRG